MSGPPRPEVATLGETAQHWDVVEGRGRWWALVIVCIGSLMIILDGTIVVVALPSIRADVGLSATLIPWLMNAYLIAFGGFLLLGGRLGDLFGHRRLFVCGTVLFSISSLACGLTHSGTVLIGARAIQGLGGAVVSKPIAKNTT